MLFVNNQELKPGMREFARYEKFLKEVLPELSDTVVFKRRKPLGVNEGTKLVEVDPRVFIPFEAKAYDPELGSQHWRYCEIAPSKNEHGKWIYKPLGKNDFKRSWSLDKSKHPDLIFFMMELCVKVKDGTIIHEDKRREARKAIEKDDKATAVKFMVTSNMSPLSPENTGSEDLLRMIAAAWGVSHAHNPRKSLDEIRVELISIVEISEKKLGESGMGYETFLDEIKTRDRVLLRANIQRAVDNRVIIYDRKDFSWKYEGSDQLIVTISTRFFNNPATGLFEHFLVNPEKKRIFYQILEDKYELKDELKTGPEIEPPVEPEDKPDTSEKTPVEQINEEYLSGLDSDIIREKLESANYWDVQKFAMEDLKLETHRKKKAQVIEEVIGYFVTKKLQPAD